jgi:pseudouridine kinase
VTAQNPSCLISDPLKFLCIGGAIIDRKYELHGPLIGATSNPGRVSTTHGGVARNITENLARLGARVALAAAIGEDDGGKAIRASLESLGVDTTPMITMSGQATGEYAAILESGTRDLALAVVAMDHAEARLAESIDDILTFAAPGMMVFADGNLPRAAMLKVIAAARQVGFLLAVDAVSIAKARRLPERLDGVSILFMNADEAADITGLADASPAALAEALVLRGAARAVVTAGPLGAFAQDGPRSSHARALSARVADVTGAGDCLVATTLWRLSLGETLAAALPWGTLAAGLTVESDKSVLPEMSPDFLAAHRWRIEA